MKQLIKDTLCKDRSKRLSFAELYDHPMVNTLRGFQPNWAFITSKSQSEPNSFNIGGVQNFNAVSDYVSMANRIGQTTGDTSFNTQMQTGNSYPAQPRTLIDNEQGFSLLKVDSYPASRRDELVGQLSDDPIHLKQVVSVPAGPRVHYRQDIDLPTLPEAGDDFTIFLSSLHLKLAINAAKACAQIGIKHLSSCAGRVQGSKFYRWALLLLQRAEFIAKHLLAICSEHENSAKVFSKDMLLIQQYGKQLSERYFYLQLDHSLTTGGSFPTSKEVEELKDDENSRVLCLLYACIHFDMVFENLRMVEVKERWSLISSPKYSSRVLDLMLSKQQHKHQNMNLQQTN